LEKGKGDDSIAWSKAGALFAFPFLFAMQLTVSEDFKQISDFRNMATNAL